MKTLLYSTIAAGFMVSTAFAAPIELTETQLDQVAAGAYHGDDGHGKGRHDDGHKRHYGKKGHHGYDQYGYPYYPYYYNKNYNDNYNDNYNYNENNNYIYISIPFFGYGGYGHGGGHYGGGDYPVGVGR